MSDPSPDPRRLRLNAALDGELDAANALAVEGELAADPALAAERRALESLSRAVRRHAPREPAPRALVNGVLALAAAGPEQASGAAPLTAPAGLSRFARLLPLAASFAALGFAGGVALKSLGAPRSSEAVADGLVSDFARAAVASNPFDVASSDRHTVKPWLAGRTTVSADVVDLASKGFPLAGGRVALVSRVPVPTLVYRHNEHTVALTELPLDAAGAPRGEGTETIDGFHVVRWRDADLAYVAVSDMDANSLADFVTAFRDARTAPAQEGGSR